MKYFPLLVAAVISFPLLGFSEDSWESQSELSKELTNLNTKLTNAYLEENVALLKTMLADDHIHNNVFGSAMDRDTFLNDIETGVLEFVKYETPELRWYIDGNMAVATGIIDAEAIRDGNPVPAKRFRFTRIFVKRDGEWKVLLFQNTMAAKKK